jgi:hypothetical protein
MKNKVLTQWIFWLGLSALLIFIHGKHLLNSDEGYVLEGAWELLNGRVIYIDSGQMVAPGSFYLISWAWQIFGTSYYVAKIMGIASILLTSVAIYCISRLLANKDNLFSFVAPLVYCLASASWATISYHTFNIAFLAWATFFFLKALSNKSWCNLAISGILTGLSILILQHKGIAFFLAALFFFLISYDQKNKYFWIKSSAIYVLFSLIPLAILFNWPIPIIINSLLFFPIVKYIKGNLTSFTPLIFSAWLVTLYFLKLQHDLTKQFKFLFIVQIALLATALQRTDVAHTMIVMFPVLSMTSIVYEKMLSFPMSKLTRYAYIASTTIAITIPTSLAIFSLIETPLFYDAVNADAKPLMQYVKSNCPTFYAGPFLPGLYFEARSDNPIFYSALITSMNTEQQFMRASIDLQKRKPNCAITYYLMVEKFNYDLNNPIDKFIQNNYLIGYEWHGVKVYRLNNK